MTARIAPAADPAAGVPEEVAVTLGGADGEFTVSTDRTTFRVGVPYHFVVTNAGQIPHEFMVSPPTPPGQMEMEGMHHRALTEIEAEDLTAGATASVDLVFTEPAPLGELELTCYVLGHYEAGMFLPIEVAA